MSPILQVLTFLTGILFALSLSAGIYGFIWGSRLGEDALAGVTQPPSSTSPVKKASDQSSAASGETLGQGFLSETEILERVKEKTSGQSKDSEPKTVDSPSPTEAEKTDSVGVVSTSLAPGFPKTTQSQGVSLEVHRVQVDEEVVNLQVFLRNESTNTVRFFYSFLTVTDNRGRSLSSSVQGLPAELPSMSENVEGEIRISKILLEDVSSITLSLADYPDQFVKLKLEDIPINLTENEPEGESKSV